MASDIPHGRVPARAVALSAAIARPGTAASLLVAGLVLLAVAIRIWLTRRVPAPWIMGDELLYSELAQSFSEKQELVFRQQPWPFLSIYPALVSPAWLAGSLESTYSIVKAMNVVLMSLVAIPVYAWGRRLVSPAYAVLAVVLVLLMPSFVYANEVMTENLAFPVIVFAFFALALALERPTIARQALLIFAVGFAFATRLQALVLCVAVPTAIVLKVLLDARAAPPASLRRYVPREIARYAVTLAVIGVTVLAYLGYKLARGGSVNDLIGQYSGILSGGYTVGGVSRWFALHAAELPYSVGLLPVSALIVLVGLAWRRGASTTSAERAFLAVTVASTFWFVLEVAAFASRYSQRIEERNLFYLAPLLLLALVVWLDRGLPRPAGLTAVAAIVPVGLLTLLPLGSLLNISIMSDTFAFVPLLRVRGIFDGSTTDMRILLGLGAIAVALVFVALPRRLAAIAVPTGIALFLGLSSYVVLGSIRVQALGAVASQGVAPNEVSWVDERVGRDAHVVFVNNIPLNENPHTLWQAEFWNRSVDSVVNLVVPQHIVLGRPGDVDPATGEIVATDGYVAERLRTARYAVAPAGLELAGEAILKRGSLLTLYRVRKPLRLARIADGLYADGWTGPELALNQYSTPGDRPGRLILRLIRTTVIRRGLVGPARATLEVGSLHVSPSGDPEFGGQTVRRSVALPENKPIVVELPVPRPPFHLELSITPSFSPADVGLADSRRLGAQLALRFAPRGPAR